MNRTFPTQIGSLVMVVGLTGLARPAAADAPPTLTIVLQVAGYRSVPPHIVTRAKAEMTRIYRDAGVNVIWINAASSTGRPDTLQSPAASEPGLALVVLPREMSDQLTVATEALGGAAGTPEQRGRMAYVFYSRVEHIARTYLNTSRRRATYDGDNVIVLGHAMAHEIGHLLLPYGHSATGLMRPDWSGEDLHHAVHGQLNFTAQQAELIRAKLVTSPAANQQTHSKGSRIVCLRSRGLAYDGDSTKRSGRGNRCFSFLSSHSWS
jgi:hypothetical protein